MRAPSSDFRRSTLDIPTSTPAEDSSSEDIDMGEAGPSAAPSNNTTFFHDD